MRMKSIILIFIALGCGLVASIGISQVMDRRGGGTGDVDTDQILIALTDIDIGSKLSASNVKLEDWPRAKIPDGAMRRLEDVKDKFATARFFKGEPIHINRIADQLGNIANKVPAGYRAMPVKVEEDTVMKAISPGDRVDVMVFLRRNGQEIHETGAFTILKNVRVFALNTSTERSTDSKGETSNFRTVSLLVKPEHARELAIAAQMGKILLTLRRPDEKDELAGEDLTPIAEILSGKSKSGSENGDSGQGSGFLQIVKDGGNTTPAHTSTADAEWKMIIMTPAERKEFSWADKNGLPSEASQTNVGTTAPASSGSSSAPTSRGAPEGASLDEPETDHKAVPGGLDKDPSKVKPGKPSA